MPSLRYPMRIGLWLQGTLPKTSQLIHGNNDFWDFLSPNATHFLNGQKTDISNCRNSLDLGESPSSGPFWAPNTFFWFRGGGGYTIKHPFGKILLGTSSPHAPDCSDLKGPFLATTVCTLHFYKALDIFEFLAFSRCGPSGGVNIFPKHHKLKSCRHP